MSNLITLCQALPHLICHCSFTELIDEIHGVTSKTDERIRIETRRVDEVRRKDSCKCTCSKLLPESRSRINQTYAHYTPIVTHTHPHFCSPVDYYYTACYSDSSDDLCSNQQQTWLLNDIIVVLCRVIKSCMCVRTCIRIYYH